MSLLEVLDVNQSLQRQAQNQPGAQPDADPLDAMIGQLDSYIESCWQAAKSAKESNVEADMLEDLRQRDGVYSPEKLQEIKAQGGSQIYMMLTNVKCRAVESWIRDILLPSGERPFTIDPPPLEDELQPEIKAAIYTNTMTELRQALQSGLYVTKQQVYERARAMYDEYQQRLKDEAKLRTEREEDAIDDALIEGQWYEALDDFVSDFSCLPCAFIKGPVVRKQKRVKWVQGPDGKSFAMAQDELVPLFYSPSALDMYPAPDSSDINDGYLFERIRFRRSAIAAMKGVPGYSEEKISAALEEYDRSGFDLAIAGDQQRRTLNDQLNWQSTPDHGIDGKEFHGSLRGQWMIDWGVDPSLVPDPDAEYEATCLKIGRFVVRCVLNEDPLGRRPYDKASFDSVKGQFWGRGLARILRGLQTMCNGLARAIQNNAAMASGPVGEVEVDRLAEGEDITTWAPWRMFQTKASATTPAPAVRFYTPPNITGDLMKVYEYFSQMADNYSGIPQYEQGVNPTTGAAGTASGLSMLMTAASRQIKRVVAAIDEVIEGSVERMHTHLLLFGTNPDVKGETTIVARGAASLIAKEQMQMRRTQFLQATANQIDAPIIGVMGRAELLRQTLKSLDIDPDDVIPSKDEMLAQQRQQQQMQQQQAEAQAQAQAQQNSPQQAVQNSLMQGMQQGIQQGVKNAVMGAVQPVSQPAAQRSAQQLWQAEGQHGPPSNARPRIPATLDHAGHRAGGVEHNLITSQHAA